MPDPPRARGIARPSGTSVTAVNKMAGKLHYHPCGTCGHNYSCSCTTPLVNGHCQTHRPSGSGRPRPLWDVARDARPCCEGMQQVTDTKEIALYQLAGPGPWFVCPLCSRHHGRQTHKEMSQ